MRHADSILLRRTSLATGTLGVRFRRVCIGGRSHCRKTKASVTMTNGRGEVTERLKVLASKASVRETVPWVRIPPSPPYFNGCTFYGTPRGWSPPQCLLSPDSAPTMADHFGCYWYSRLPLIVFYTWVWAQQPRDWQTYLSLRGALTQNYRPIPRRKIQLPTSLDRVVGHWDAARGTFPVCALIRPLVVLNDLLTVIV
jgi:hypothetical protein